MTIPKSYKNCLPAITKSICCSSHGADLCCWRLILCYLPTYLRKMLDIMNIDEVLVSRIIWPTFNGVATKCYIPADDVFHSDFFFSFRYLIEITSDFLIISDIGYILIKIQVTFQTDHLNFFQCRSPTMMNR